MPVYMKNLTWSEFQAQKTNIMILPVGSMEQHGPHLPLCTDTTIIEAVAAQLAEQVNGVVLPSINYGYKSAARNGGATLFMGTIDNEGDTVKSAVHDVLVELVRDGIRKIVVLNGHQENAAFIVEAIDCVSRETGRSATIVASNWWDGLDSATLKELFGENACVATVNAGLAETSLMLHVAPELCRMDAAVDGEPSAKPMYVRYPVKNGDISANGLIAPCTGATAEAGAKLMEKTVEVLHEICRIEYGVE